MDPGRDFHFQVPLEPDLRVRVSLLRDGESAVGG